MNGHMLSSRSGLLRMLPVLLLLPIPGVAADGTESPLFPNPGVDTGGAVIAVATADFNNDSLTDLVTVDEHRDCSEQGCVCPPEDWPCCCPGHNATLILRRGDGSYQRERFYTGGKSPTDVAAADLNRDGLTDLVVTDDGERNVSVLLGDGRGHFTYHATSFVGPEPRKARIRDLDLDGDEDVVVLYRDGVAVLIGSGDGHLGPPMRYAPGARSVGIGKVDADDIPDLVVGGYPGLSVYPGNGDGTFAEDPKFLVELPSASAESIAVGDLDADGRDDIVVGAASLYAPGFLYMIFLVDPLSGPRERARFPIESGGADIILEDVNGDGRKDILGGGLLTVIINDGDGRFHGGPESGIEGREFVTGQFDHDTSVDLVQLGAWYPRYVYILPGNADGTFGHEVRSPMPGRTAVIKVIRRDQPGPHELVVLQDYPQPSVELLRGDADGSFTKTGAIALSEWASNLEVVDLNHDERPDLLVPLWTSGTVSVFLGDETGGFTPCGDVPLSAPPYDIAAVDLDGDSSIDLILTLGDSNAVTVLRGRGDCTFGSEERYALSGSASLIAAGDFDGNGAPDIAVVVDWEIPRIAVLANDGTGTLSPPIETSLPDRAFDLAAADLDGDGRDDLSVGTGEGLSIFLASADGILGANAHYPSAALVSLQVGDYDGDQNRDVAALLPEGVEVHFGDGTGLFPRRAAFGAGGPTQALASDDLNDDGSVDLIVGNARVNWDDWPTTTVSHSRIAVLLNRGEPPPEVRIECPGPINIDSRGVTPIGILSTADFDATLIIPATVVVSGARVTRTPDGTRYLCAVEDINVDGMNDMVCKVATRDLRLDVAEPTVVLEAQTTDGRSIRGVQEVRVVPPRV